MKIPFGKKSPTEEESKSLQSLGFDLSKINKHDDGNYWLEIPNKNSSHVRCIKQDRRYDLKEYEIFYGDYTVIKIYHKNAVYDDSVNFEFWDDNINTALKSDPDKFTFDRYNKLLQDDSINISYFPDEQLSKEDRALQFILNNNKECILM